MPQVELETMPRAPISQRERAAYRPVDLQECHARLKVYFDDFAAARGQWRDKNLGYHRELERLYRYYIPENASVLEVGCGTGDLLAALKPARGLGLDLSPKMVELARAAYPELRFETSAAETFEATGESFDYIVLSDLLPFAYDILLLLQKLKAFCHPRTRVVINIHSRLWQPALALAESLGLKYRQPVLNWVTTEDVVNLLGLAGFDTVQRDSRILLPKRVPLLSRFANSWLAPFAPFRWFCVSNWVVARPLPVALGTKELSGTLDCSLPSPTPQQGAATSRCSLAPAPATVSVICPCRNEAGNIAQIARRLPQMGAHTELIFVEGNSKDETYDACLTAQRENPQRDIMVLKQTGRGKKDAVWLGFSKAKGDILMILDADISVAPEDLTAFYNAIVSGRAEFVNGSRLVYPMEGKAMRFLNLLGNKFFSLAFSYLIGQHVKDTLCGTKVLLRSDFEKLNAGRAYFGDFDPFGDFDLLFGAAKLGLKIVDLPVRYRERVYGETQISRFRHGWMLLKMCGVGLRRLKMR